MARKKQAVPKKTPGRKPVSIDWIRVERFIQAGCNGEEVASAIGIHADTLYRRMKEEGIIGEGTDYPHFTAYYQSKRSHGDSLLKVKQFEMAMSGNIPMLIWLGKQRLGQSEKMEMKHDNEPAVEYKIGGQILTIAKGKAKQAEA